MRHDHEIEILARERQADLLREAAAARRLRELPPAPTPRARLAGILIALAARLAPAGQAAPARQIAEPGPPA
ncbi:MAG TPA: hypothetical protein VFL91_24390 [Thermomicrobiales bacterium]|nr:hypothetical protein [Thermomicrobiales bacterium]